MSWTVLAPIDFAKEIQLTKEEANQLKTTKDLKKILATADQCSSALLIVGLGVAVLQGMRAAATELYLYLLEP